MINPTDFSMGPEDILEIDILPNLSSSAGYQHNITMIDVFSRYLFAYPTQNMTAQTVGKCIVQEITKILDLEIRHATTKHAHTIGILERTHASIKTALQISTGGRIHGHSLSWTHSLQRTGSQTRDQTPMATPTQHRVGRSTTETAQRDAKCSQGKPNVVIHQIQALLRQKSGRSPIECQRVLLRSQHKNR